MTNLDKVSMTLSEWAFKVAKSILPQVRIPIGGKMGGLMQILGVDPATYNIWNELGFLAEPLIQTLITPAVVQMLGNIPDGQIPDLMTKYVDAFIEQAKKKGTVNLFGVELEVDDLTGLRSMLDSRFNAE